MITRTMRPQHECENDVMTVTSPERQGWTIPAMQEHSGASYRQIAYWTQRGWLHTRRDSTGGWPHTYEPAEAEVAKLMVRLINIGFMPSNASEIARHLAANGETVAPFIGPGGFRARLVVDARG